MTKCYKCGKKIPKKKDVDEEYFKYRYINFSYNGKKFVFCSKKCLNLL